MYNDVYQLFIPNFYPFLNVYLRKHNASDAIFYLFLQTE